MDTKTNADVPESPHGVSVHGPTEFVRFSNLQRAEHILVMVFFTILIITGLPQKFHESSWAHWLVQLLGGIDATRLVHRIAGGLFALLAVFHLGRVTILVALRKAKPAMLPVYKDFRDAVVTLRYNLGLTEENAQFDRFDFRQKFEYLGLLMGGVVMIVTGAILIFPVFVTQFLPGVLIPAAKTAHSYESLLAFLALCIWHTYGAHFSPEVFPADTSIFTGKISRERMEHEHSLELARLLPPPPPPEPAPVKTIGEGI